VSRFVAPSALADFTGIIVDCRFSLAASDAGSVDYGAGHIPGAIYLDLEADMSAARGLHGGRHPLPTPAAFAATLAARGIGPETEVVLYDDSGYVFAARCWWMMRALGYREPRLLAGGYSAWLGAGGIPEQTSPEQKDCAVPPAPECWPLCCDREQLARLQAQGAALVDAREPGRYRGEHEPIDPVAGHIPGADNLPWQSLISDAGLLISEEALREAWGAQLEAQPLVIYCGSGVSACVNILSLAILGRDDVWLYGGSWSDWCSYL
jgi:thiosulfate/3-mercaptopyruvate sulfurtransferase